MNSSYRILIIDDDARLRELLLRYLGEQGYLVEPDTAKPRFIQTC